MADEARDAQPDADRHDGEQVYIAYRRNGKLQWRELTVGMRDDQVRAVIFANRAWEEPLPSGRPGKIPPGAPWIRKKDGPPRDGSAEAGVSAAEETDDGTRSEHPVCYWVDGQLVCDDT